MDEMTFDNVITFLALIALILSWVVKLIWNKDRDASMEAKLESKDERLKSKDEIIKVKEALIESLNERSPEILLKNYQSGIAIMEDCSKLQDERIKKLEKQKENNETEMVGLRSHGAEKVERVKTLTVENHELNKQLKLQVNENEKLKQDIKLVSETASNVEKIDRTGTLASFADRYRAGAIPAAAKPLPAWATADISKSKPMGLADIGALIYQEEQSKKKAVDLAEKARNILLKKPESTPKENDGEKGEDK